MCKKQLWAVDRTGARRKRSERWRGSEGDVCKMGARVCRWRDSTESSCKKKKKTDLRSRVCWYQAAPVQRHLSPQHKSIFPPKWNWYVYSCFFPPFSLFVWLSFFSSLLMGKWRVFGSYLDNSHIFPGPPRALEEEALVALPLSQSGTQLCASYSAQHYLVTAAASLGLSETKSSQSQLSLLLNGFLFSAMHLLELFHEGKKKRKIKSNKIFSCSILKGILLFKLQLQQQYNNNIYNYSNNYSFHWYYY